MWLLIATDNTNAFDIFASLNALLIYNIFLISAINILLDHDIDLQVVYIPRPGNIVADTLSQYHNDLTNMLVSGLQAKNFNPLGMHWVQ